MISSLAVTRRVPHVSPSHPEHLRSTQFLVGFKVIDLEYSVYCFVDRCLPFCSFSFGLSKNDDKTKTKKELATQ